METNIFTKMTVDVGVFSERYRDGVVMPVQTHSATVREIRSGLEDVKDCDALVTGNPELCLGVHTRDCAPICFADGQKIAIAHVGWPGLCKGMVEAVMAHFDPQTTEVFVGPHLHTFEIKRDFCYDAVTEKFGERFLTDDNGVLTFNFKEAIAACLPKHTVFDERNTALDTTLPSYRHKRTIGHIITSMHFKFK